MLPPRDPTHVPPGRPVRIAAIAALAAGLGFAAWQARTAAADRPILYVYLHTDVKSTVLEKALQAKMPELGVTVFGRFRDLEVALGTTPPDAILALAPLLASRKLEPSLRGVSSGRVVEAFVLLSAGAPFDGPVGTRTIGVVDLLGRKETQAFVADLLKTPDVHIKLVTKLEDLLSLLQFSAADAILVPEGQIKAFTDRSRLPLHVRKLPDAIVGRAQIAILNERARDTVLRNVRNLDPATNRMMDVDGWRAP